MKQTYPDAEVGDILAAHGSTGQAVTDSKCRPMRPKMRINVNEAYHALPHLTPATLTFNQSGTGSGMIEADGCGGVCGSVGCTDSATYKPGAIVTITATPATGSALGDWTGCDAETATTCMVTMIDDRSVTGAFAPPPRIALTPATFSFGKESIGGHSHKTITVTNHGLAKLRLKDFELKGANLDEFGGFLTSGCHQPIAKGDASCMITIFPWARGFGAKSASLSFHSNDPSQPTVTSNISSAIAAMKLSVIPSRLTFTGKVGLRTPTKKINIKNTGTSDLELSSIKWGDEGGQKGFAFDSNCPWMLSQNESCSIVVDFTAFDAGTTSTSIEVVSSDPVRPSMKQSIAIPIKGMGK